MIDRSFIDCWPRETTYS